MRLKKLVRKQGGNVSVTHYLGAGFEHHRWGGGENNHVHVMDGERRIALVRIGAAHPGDQGPAIAFHLADLRGSGGTVVDAAGALVNREEFTPYGETSFGSYARKRYRFIGRERDEESGLGIHGARYYASVLCRWISPDPSGPADSIGLYQYAKSNPMTFNDTNGKDAFSVVDAAIRGAEHRMNLHLDRYNKYSGNNDGKARAEVRAYWKSSAQRDFLQSLKPAHEWQDGVGLSYHDYPVTKRDVNTGLSTPDTPWRQTADRQNFGAGEQGGSFCLGSSRGMAVRATFGLAKPTYINVLTDMKTKIESAKQSPDVDAEAAGIISRIVSHSHDAGSLQQFNADLGDRYDITNVKFQSAGRAEAFAALEEGARVVMDLSGAWHWVMVAQSPEGDLWALDPLRGNAAIRQITKAELGTRAEIIVDATTGKPIIPGQGGNYEKKSRP